MVSFRSLVAGVALVVAPVVAAVTPDQIAQGINTLTRLSREIQTPANSISVTNAPLIIVGQGPFPEIIRGFNQIVASAARLVGQISGLAEVEIGPDADLVYNSFRQFSTEHVALLNILNNKVTLLDQVTSVGPHVADVLRIDQSVVDGLSTALINKVPSYETDFSYEASAIDVALVECINEYTSLDG